MTAVLADLPRWHLPGVRILRVEPTADHGVRLDVHELTPAIERRLCDYYTFRSPAHH